jgi:hypothetical protein
MLSASARPRKGSYSHDTEVTRLPPPPELKHPPRALTTHALWLAFSDLLRLADELRSRSAETALYVHYLLSGTRPLIRLVDTDKHCLCGNSRDDGPTAGSAIPASALPAAATDLPAAAVPAAASTDVAHAAAAIATARHGTSHALAARATRSWFGRATCAHDSRRRRPAATPRPTVVAPRSWRAAFPTYASTHQLRLVNTTRTADRHTLCGGHTNSPQHVRSSQLADPSPSNDAASSTTLRHRRMCPTA